MIKRQSRSNQLLVSLNTHSAVAGLTTRPVLCSMGDDNAFDDPTEEEKPVRGVDNFIGSGDCESGVGTDRGSAFAVLLAVLNYRIAEPDLRCGQ